MRRERSSHSSHRVENVRRAWFILAVTTREVARAVPTGRDASASRSVSSCRGVAAPSSLVSSLVLLGSQSPGLLCVPGRARKGISFFLGGCLQAEPPTVADLQRRGPTTNLCPSPMGTAAVLRLEGSSGQWPQPSDQNGCLGRGNQGKWGFTGHFAGIFTPLRAVFVQTAPPRAWLRTSRTLQQDAVHSFSRPDE